MKRSSHALVVVSPHLDDGVFSCGDLLVALIATVSRLHEVAWVAACVWLAHTGWFAATRLRGTSRHPLHVLEMIVTSAGIPPLSIMWRLLGAWRYRVVFL